MLTSHERLSMYALIDSGISITEISRRTGRSVGTVQKYRKARQLEEGGQTTPPYISPKIIPIKTLVDARIKKGRINAVRLFDDVKAEGYQGSYSLLNSYVRAHRVKTKYYKPSEKVDHIAGYQAQMDWGSFGKIKINGEVKRLYAFLYILCHSRALYVEFVVKQNLATLESCHKNAFRKLGIPKAIRYDNMKPVVLSRQRMADGSIRIHYNPEFFNFANHYGFEIELCPPYWPRAKGKVEAAVKYLRYNFMTNEQFGKTFFSLREINDKVTVWVDQCANQRTHRSTLQKPIEMWEKEKRSLRFVDDIPSFSTQPFLPARANKDGFLQYKSNFYELPKDLGQKKLYIRPTEHQGLPKLEIYKEDILIFTHDVSNGRGLMVSMNQPNLEVVSKSKKHKLQEAELHRKVSIDVPSRDVSYYDLLISQKGEGGHDG